MKLDVIQTNYQPKGKLLEILEQKVKRLDKYFPDSDTVCKIVLSQQGKRCTMEVSINYKGTTIRSEVKGDTMYYNIDECLPKLERQIVKHKDKLYSKGKAPKDDYQFISHVEVEPIEIKKVKKFTVEKITPEEAVENLELVGHDFFVFCNVQTGNVEVVYKREDGSIGLLQPEVV